MSSLQSLDLSEFELKLELRCEIVQVVFSLTTYMYTLLQSSPYQHHFNGISIFKPSDWNSLQSLPSEIGHMINLQTLSLGEFQHQCNIFGTPVGELCG